MIDTLERPSLERSAGFAAGVSVRRISWGSVFAGVAIALAIQLALGILGVGIGASALHPSGAASAQSFGVGSAIWLFVSTMLALFAGGWVAGRLAGVPRAVDSALHGVIAWSLTTILAVYLVSTAIGGLLGGAGALLGNVVGAAGSGIAAAAPSISSAAGGALKENGVTVDTLTSQIRSALAAPGAQHAVNEAKNAAAQAANDPSSARTQYNDLAYRFLHDTGTTSASADREKLIDAVASREHVSHAAATKTVDGWSAQAQAAQQQLSQAAQGAKDTALKAGDAAASGVATTGITAFFFLLLGAAAAGFGGWTSGARKTLAVR
jgi:hypothetical protein